MTQFLDPMLLGLVPPMDLGLGDPEYISPFPMKLRTHDNSAPPVGSVGLFGARRDAPSPGLIRMHEGVDLLAPIGTEVFAVQDGTVVSVTGTSVFIEHSKGFRFFSFYQHLQNILVRPGDVVVQGQRMAEVGPFTASDTHLHFELRYPFDQTRVGRESSLAVDPTWALYEWEKKRYRNDQDSRHEVLVEPIYELNEIVRGRLLRFVRIRARQRLRSNIYFPLGNLDDADRSMVETLREAFIHKKKVELVWRESLFFNQIEYRHDEDDKVAILAEVRVTQS